MPENIKIITYTPSNNKIALIRKCINLCKQIKFRITYKNKFDFSACYATYSYPASFMSQVASKNRAIWVHNNYMNFYDNDIQKYREFLKSWIFIITKILYLCQIWTRKYLLHNFQSAVKMQ